VGSHVVRIVAAGMSDDDGGPSQSELPFGEAVACQASAARYIEPKVEGWSGGEGYTFFAPSQPGKVRHTKTPASSGSHGAVGREHFWQCCLSSQA